MTESERTRTPTSSRTASEWFAARRAPHDAMLEQEFLRWLAEDRAHVDAYALCELAWEISQQPAMEVAGELRAPARLRRRSALLAAALISGTILFLAFQFLQRPVTKVWRTNPGEQIAIVLDDGSRVTLNTRSVLEAQMRRSSRELRLLEGEAFFEVQKDPGRPFVVNTPLGSARALGTQFNVFLDDKRVEVSTEEGSVLVRNAQGAAAGAVVLAGVRATLTPHEAAVRLDRANLDRIANWRAQRLEFDHAPLADVLAEFSRYTTMPIRPSSDDIARIPVSAVLRVGDMDALRSTLQSAFQLQLIPGRSEWVVARQSAP